MRRYCTEHKCDPHEWMADVLKKPGVALEIKMQAAKELAQYLEPKLRSTELSGNNDNPVRLVIETVSYADPEGDAAS